ncbi:hypothetical protein [Streptomyces sp. NPDC059814]|uniref:hypothetical protein n=1 Tax=Streptomyces sp. NPDC059814 TaxID=3346959 RepID=UPI00365E5B83
MLRGAASDAGRAYKQELLDLLDIQAGQIALDVGCGPGTDLPALAERVGDRGTVIGVTVTKPCSPGPASARTACQGWKSVKATRTTSLSNRER